LYQHTSIDDPVVLAEAYAQLGADPGVGRRFALALVLAIALVALLLGAVRWHPADDREAAPLSVVLEREPSPVPTARPTPPPTPPPTPLPRIAHATPAPVAERAAPRRAAAAGGTRPVPTVQPTMLPTAFVATSAPEPVPAGVAGGAPASGAGSGTGAGSGNGAGAGTGAGNGTGGTGTGQVNADVPCGAVEFIPDDAARTVRGTIYERIRATVHFRDGHTESAVFPYEWVYPNGEQTDPWSNTNIGSHDAIPAQLPPPGSDPRRFPPLIRYILTHTSSSGTTLLEECPTLRP
jgi:hypothetical protein